LNIISKNPYVTRKELSQKIPNSTVYGIRYNLERLKDLGIIVREGGDKGGIWRLV
jgi:predicted HTH transcriptional regulator